MNEIRNIYISAIIFPKIIQNVKGKINVHQNTILTKGKQL